MDAQHHLSLGAITNSISALPRIEFPTDSRYLPIFVALLVTGLQILRTILFQVKSRVLEDNHAQGEDRGSADVDDESMDLISENFKSRLGTYIKSYGGYTILGFAVANLAGNVILLGLSFVTLQRFNKHAASSVWTCAEFSLAITFLYTSILGSIAVVSLSLRHSAARWKNIILLSTLGVYVYRDVYPLATYNKKPADLSEGALVWIKIFILFTLALVMPLFSPRQYVPVDPKNPMPIPNPEQVTPWISRLTYSYIDRVIILASKVKHLRHDQLPPLADIDYSQYQAKCAFPKLDPFIVSNSRHIFFGLLSYFRREYMILTLCVFLKSFWSFVAPIGIKKTLEYLEGNREGGSTRPWVWITFLLVGPLCLSLTEHWDVYIETRVRVLVQALLTQLVFEHSLRVRIKSEVPNEPSREPLQSDDAENMIDSVLTTTTIPSDEYDSVPQDDRKSVATETQTINSSRGTSTQASIKGKSKLASHQATPVPATKTVSSGSGNLVGRINNLVTTDMENLVEGLDILSLTLLVPLQIILSLVFLYQILGWSAFVGFFTTLALAPVGGYVGKQIQDVQVAKMKLTDARVQNISEAVSVLRMVKLFGWESKMSKRLDQTREDELEWLWKMKKLKLWNMITSFVIPTFCMALTYGTFTVIMKRELNASIIFSSMAVLSIMRDQLSRISWQTALMIEAKVSLDRINNFLHETELLDRFKERIPRTSASAVIETGDQSQKLGFRNASFAWSTESEDGSLTPSSRRFRLRINGELLFKRGRINLIIGPTGSGKTSMLMALLGEMHFIDSDLDSWFNLPRGGVAYAAQESWVQNATIRENILFQSPYDEERYKKVIRQCALERDLELFDAGDETEVGERGLTLSGGQKARITLARAIYSQAEIILLDDVLAALDVHTSVWIVDQCFRGDLVKGRTVLLVTHNIALAGPVADFVVSIGLNGNVQTQGTDVTAAIESDPILALEVVHDQQRLEVEKEDRPSEVLADGKLVISEEIVEGHITWRSMKLLLSGFGGEHPILFSFVILLGVAATQGAWTLQAWFLGFWGSQYERHLPSEVPVFFYLAGFSSLLIAHISLFAITNFYFNYRSINASRMIHAKLVDSVFGSTLRWLDETPTARIISRCTQDIRTIDGPITQSLMWVIDQGIGASAKLFVIALFTPIFVFPGLAIGAFGIWMGNLYLKAQLSVKREMSNARSPLLAHFSAAINGLTSIRAYGAEQSFKDDSHKRIDHYSRTARISYNLNRWIGFRIDFLGAAFTAGLASYLVYGQTVSASNTGFSLNMAVSFTTYIFWLIRIFNELEVEANSLERVQGYLDIDHEPKPTQSGEPPASWPTSGDLRVENLSARYSQSGPKVLHSVSFHITSGQRIGVVGRTGSGKSSLTLALLRCILTEGAVYYDGVLTGAVNLDALRSSITIIPQTPELLSGTLRQNLDPFDQKDDATLNAALRDAGLFSLQEDEEVYMTLDSQIAGSGSNMSVGQRQIVALARAMVRESKLLILDEATSAIDYKTDAVIQDTLRNKLGHDVTVITVAHRLQTIMDADKIMVLDAGNIVEFDTPKILLEKEKGALQSLVEGSGDRSTLHALAQGKHRL